MHPINGLVLLPLALAAIAFIAWLIHTSDDPPEDWDETASLPLLADALGYHGIPASPARYAYAVKPDVGVGYDELRFYENGVLMGAFLIRNGEAEALLSQVCRHLVTR